MTTEHQPIVPIPWRTLFLLIASTPHTSVVVDFNGRAQYPDEWAHELRHYKPNERDRYAVMLGRSRCTVHAVCPTTGRFLSAEPAWVLRPAPPAIVMETGGNDAFFWRLTDDDRIEFRKGLTDRLTYRLFPDVYRDGALDPVAVYRAGEWDMETESRAKHLADRIAERLTIYRGQRAATIDHLPQNTNKAYDEGNAA